MAKQRQTRLSKADINRIVDRAISETLEKEADEGLCKVYCEYLIEWLDNIENQEIEMIEELKQQALTDKQIERLDYMVAMEVNLYRWAKCRILQAYLEKEGTNAKETAKAKETSDVFAGLYLAEC